MYKSIIIKIYKLTLFFLFLSSMLPWFLWYIPNIYIKLFGAFISVLFLIKNLSRFVKNKQNFIINTLLFLALLWDALHLNINGAIGNLLTFITISILINTKTYFKISILNFITKYFSLLIAISLFFYILYLIGIRLPYSNLTTSELGYGGNNYYFFTTKHSFLYNRFKSIFAEPGHLTMGVIPLILANRFNLKSKNVMILIISILFSLSLAGYITLIYTFSLFFLSSFSLRKLSIYLAFLTIIAASLWFINTNTDNRILKIAIEDRLEFNSSDEIITGNNRTKDHTDYIFENQLKGYKFLFGLKHTEYKEAIYGSAGYKVFLIRNGLIGVVLCLLFYFRFALYYWKYETFILLSTIIILLYQNSYPFWYPVIFSFILGTVNLSKNNFSK